MRSTFSVFFLFFLLMLSVIGIARNAIAQTIIRDSEIESYLSQWFQPIFEANGMNPSQVKTILVQDSDINAFVAGGSNIFFYTGLIERTDNAAELIGVMAHELGHISGGHLVRGREAMEQASYESILGTIIGLGTAIATGDSAAVGAGSLAGGSMAQRRFLAKTRGFESSADQAALNSLSRAKINPDGFLSFMKKLEGEEMLTTDQQSEYVRTHPLTRNRIAFIENGVSSSPYKGKAYPAAWKEQHARMKAKLIGYITPQKVAWVYDSKDKSVAADYARAIAAFRTNKIEDALRLINGLIAQEPDNAYFHELKGQMLVTFGRVKEGINPYQKAVQLKPQDGLIHIALAHALIEANTDSKQAELKKAIDHLQTGIHHEPKSILAHRLLATAYGRMGNEAMARLHVAEQALLENKKTYANEQAKIALAHLPKNSAAALRAQDILRLTDKK